MDAIRLFNILCLLCVLLVQVVVGRPKCTGRWAIHSCGGGNGKRSGIELPGEETPFDRELPGLDASQQLLEAIRTRNEDGDGYLSRSDDSALPSYIPSASQSDRDFRTAEDQDNYDERLDNAWRRIIARLLEEKATETNY